MLRLSEAIRLGAMLKPQGFGTMERYEMTCALGAARDAGFSIYENDYGYAVESEWSLLGADYPSGSRYAMDYHLRRNSVYRIIQDLNDCDRWTREAIADFVESVERQREQPVHEQTQAQETLVPVLVTA